MEGFLMTSLPQRADDRQGVHLDTRREAKRLWPRTEEVVGRGEWASVSYCPGGGTRFPREPYLTVYLYATREQAQAAKDSIDQTACGGNCWGANGHFIVHLSERERIATLNAQFFPAPQSRRNQSR